MKKILTILVLVAVVFTTFVACSSSPSSGNKKCYVHLAGKTKYEGPSYFLACDKDKTWYLYKAFEVDSENTYSSGNSHPSEQIEGTLDKATKTIKFDDGTTFDMKTKTLTTGEGSFKCDSAALKSFTPTAEQAETTILTCKCYGAVYTLKNASPA